MGEIGSEVGDLGGALLGGVAGGVLGGSKYYIPAAVGGAVLGSMLGRRASGYLGDRVYEVVTGKDEEREKALSLLNMYLSPQEMQAVNSRLPQR
jgi:outer membrane lipoprotein SlyB